MPHDNWFWRHIAFPGEPSQEVKDRGNILPSWAAIRCAYARGTLLLPCMCDRYCRTLLCTAPLIDASTHSSLRLHCCTQSPCVFLNIWLLRQIIISETRTPLIDASTHSLELSNSFSIFPNSSYFSTSAVSTVRSVPPSSPLATAQFTHQTQAD